MGFTIFFGRVSFLFAIKNRSITAKINIAPKKKRQRHNLIQFHLTTNYLERQDVATGFYYQVIKYSLSSAQNPIFLLTFS